MPSAGVGIGFWLRGAPIEPLTDPAWHAATPSQRRAFWRHVATLAVEVYGAERERGVDRFGRKLAPLKRRTVETRRSEIAPWATDPTAPPLIPAHGLSRTTSLLVSRATPDGVWFRWRRWHRQNWGQVLLWHAQGMVRGAPARDVMGISPKGVQKLAILAWQWWEANRPAGPPLTVFGVPIPLTRRPRPLPPPTGPLFPAWGSRRTVARPGGHIDYLTAPAPKQAGSVSTGWRQFRRGKSR